MSFLIVFSPLAFGSVHPWAFALMEATIFVLVILWTLRISLPPMGNERVSRLTPYASRLAARLGVPLAVFFGFVLFQLAPLPPKVLQFLSPATYDLYRRSLPGWPEKIPYASLPPSERVAAGSHRQPAAVLPTEDEVRAGARVPFDTAATQAAPAKPEPNSTPHTSYLKPRAFPATWLPLSMAPSRTWSDLLKMLSYGALFFLLLLYPFSTSTVSGRRTESDNQAHIRVVRLILLTVVFSGLIVAALGLIQRVTWNGKILWFFIPYDWAFGGGSGGLRASGPFINPDHFANYLALVLPLALGVVMYGGKFFDEPSALAAKIFGGLAALLAFAAILLSLSRSGWITAILGVALLLWLAGGGAQRGRIRAGKRPVVIRGAIALMAGLLIVALFIVGPGGREDLDNRLQETVTRNLGLAGRADLWRDTLKMVRDFPLFGVGLGSWQELFPRYQSPPWSPTFYREAHNDYLELLAETGVAGVLLLLWFFMRAGKHVVAHLVATLHPASAALLSMLVAALGTMAFHEFLDFNLQIPANALLFTVLFALAARLVLSMRSEAPQTLRVEPLDVRLTPHPSRLTASAVMSLALCLTVAALGQEKIAYPHNLKMPDSFARAAEMIRAHPALSTPHIYVLRLQEHARYEWRLDELRAAAWLNPNDPFIRDHLAVTLLRLGKKQEGLQEINQSIANAPHPSSHFYLNGRLLPWFTDEEKNAVEGGFRKALARGHAGAVEGLSGFYEATSRFSDQAKLWEEAATRAKQAEERTDFMIKAATSYGRAGESRGAERLLQDAVSTSPRDPRAYKALALTVYVPRGDNDSIGKTISNGIKNGAPEFDLELARAEAMHLTGTVEETRKALDRAQESLEKAATDNTELVGRYLVLADSAKKMNYRNSARSALLHALELRPSSSDILRRLAYFYAEESNLQRAAYYFRRYADLNPDASEAFYNIALIEEGQYRFAAAEEAYRRAVELAPENAGIRSSYASFKARIAGNQRSAGAGIKP